MGIRKKAPVQNRTIPLHQATERKSGPREAALGLFDGLLNVEEGVDLA